MRLIILAMIGFMLQGCGGFHAMAPSEMQIQRVVEIKDTPKDLLFDKSRMWYAQAFRTANAVIQYENKEKGTIMGNGNVTDSVMTVPFTLRFSVTTEVKDNRARITATGQSLFSAKQGEMLVNRRMWENFKDHVEGVVNDYELYLKSSTSLTKTDNW